MWYFVQVLRGRWQGMRAIIPAIQSKMETTRQILTTASSSVTLATTSSAGLLGSVETGAAKLKSLNIEQSKEIMMTSHTELQPLSFILILAEFMLFVFTGAKFQTFLPPAEKSKNSLKEGPFAQGGYS